MDLTAREPSEERSRERLQEGRGGDAAMAVGCLLRRKPVRWENSGEKHFFPQVAWWLRYRASNQTRRKSDKGSQRVIYQTIAFASKS